MLTLSSLATSTSGVLVSVLAFVLVLSIVVFVHEFGHFLVARWCGVNVKTFSIGFGREIFGFNDQQGHALAHRLDPAWRLRQIPR